MDWGTIFSSALTQAFGPGVIVYALAAIGLNIQFGYTGLLNFGQAAFAAVGGVRAWRSRWRASAGRSGPAC